MFSYHPQLSATADERADKSKLYKLMTVKELEEKTAGKVNPPDKHLGLSYEK